MNSMWDMSPLGLFQAGGPLMFPILLCSIISLALIIEKSLFFLSIGVNPVEFKRKIFSLIQKNEVQKALQECNKSRSPIAQILKAGLTHFTSDREQMKEAIEDVSLFQIPKLESRLTALATIAHISPLLGLLGTVTGMVTTFYTIQQRAASLNPVSPGDLAGGIGEALLTTVAGLVVAIPTFIAYNFFVHKVNRSITHMEQAATELIQLTMHVSQTSTR